MSIECPRCQIHNPLDSKFCKECAAPLHADAQGAHTKTLETPQEELTTGSIFAGRYHVIEELGKGGMGKVYRALDKKLDEEIALKLIRPEIAADNQTIERFKNELKLARKIRQKNVGSMFEFLEEEGIHYITMEYVSGQDLKGLIRQSGRLAVPTAISIAKQICSGLVEAHKLGIIHRDLKPSNVMIDKEGKARIMDFGIARSIKGKGLTGRGVLIGTPEYMSPEQVEAKEVDQRSDIYSLGIILYEMITGRLPFEADTPFAVGVKQKSETPLNPKELNPQIPDELSRVILKCLEKERENRPQSAGELLTEIAQIDESFPTTERIEPKTKPLTSKEITVRLSFKKLLIPAIAVVILVTAAFFLLIYKRDFDLNPERVFVAIFDNHTGDLSLDPIGPMTSEWITQGLLQTGVVEVVPTAEIAAVTSGFQGENIIRYLAEETGAGTAILGAYYLQGESIRFQTQVTDVKKGKVLHALEPVSGSVKNPIEPLEHLRQKLMGALAVIFDPELRDFISLSTRLPKYEAYKEYVEGTNFFVRRQFRTSIQHLTRAVELDPNYTLPLLFAGVAHYNLGEYAEAEVLTGELEKSPESLSPADRIWLEWMRAVLSGDNPEQLRLCREYVQLSPAPGWIYNLGLHANRCNRPHETIEVFKRLDPEKGMMKNWVSYWSVLTRAHYMLGKHKQELKEARRGREQYPEHLSTLSYEIRALATLGKIEELKKGLDESINLPYQSGWSPGGLMRTAAGELRMHGYREASIDAAERAIAYYKAREDEDVRYNLARSYYLAEKLEDAEKLFKELATENPDSIGILGYLGTTAARMDDSEEAERISEELDRIEQPYLFGNHVYWRACIDALLGKKESAVNLLRDALAQGLSFTRLYGDIDMEPLQDYPPYKELIKPKK